MLKAYRNIGLAVIGAIALVTVSCSQPITRVTDVDVGIERSFSGEIKDKVVEQGLHVTILSDIIKVSKRNLVLEVDTRPVTAEKVPMASFKTKINYGIVEQNAAIAYKTEKASNEIVEGETMLMSKYIKDITDASVQTAVSKYKALDVNDHRTEIEAEIKQELNKRLKLGGKDKFAVVNEVNILGAKPHDSIVQSSLAIVNSQNALKTKQNELEVAKTETEVKRVLAENASEKYIDLQRAEAEKIKAEALLVAANKGTLNSMIIVPEKFTGLGQVR